MSTIPATNVAVLTFDGRVTVPTVVMRSLEAFREWVHSKDFPADVRASFIAGNIEVDMTPENIEFHNKVKTELVVRLGALVRERSLGNLHSDRILLICPEADLSTEPDLLFWSWETRVTGRVRFGERVPGSGEYVELIGAPDLAVEIVSKSSVRKDTVLLRGQYYRAGIPEYWLIDARGNQIDFQILVRGFDGYVPVPPDADEFRHSPVFETRFRLERQRDRLSEFEYRLLQR
jgi:Uma2 family endonuclease